MDKKIYYFLLAIILLPVFVVAQNIDSLKLELKNAKHDTTRCNILNSMIEAENDELIWSKYNEELLSIAQKKSKLTTKNNPEFLIYQKYIAAALNNNGVLASSKYDFKNALLFYDKSLQIQESIHDKKGIATTQSNIGFIYRNIGNLKKALEYYTKSIKTQEEIADQKGVAVSYNNISSVYRDSGNNIKALFYLEKSLEIREKINDKEGLAATLNNMGALFNFQGDIKKAIEYYMRSIKITESINNISSLPTLLTNLGIIYNDLNEYSNALKYFKRSLEIQKKIDDQKGISYSLNYIGMVYLNQNKFDEAYNLFNEGLKIQEENDFKQGMASSLNNIGGVFNRKKDEVKALFYYEKSLKILQEIKDLPSIAKTLNNIGIAYFKLKKYNESIKNCTQAFKIAKEIGSPELIRNSSKQLYLTYKEKGMFNESLENYEIFIQMRDSINNIETQKATIKQQAKYEFDKQQTLEKEKHDAELFIQKEKADVDRKKQQVIIFSVCLVLLLVGVFSFLLYKRFKKTQQQKLIIEAKEKETQHQKEIIEEKQKEILDSINYAKRIQYTLLAHDQFLKHNLNEHFTYFNPKDIVSGDFYWATSTGSVSNEKFYLAVCDSTGHGVPGAFMSLLNIGFLSEAINEKGIEQPNEVFDYVRERLILTISKEGQKDGFDGILLCIDKTNNKITYAAANNAPILILKSQGTEALEVSGDKNASSTQREPQTSAPNFKLIELPADRMPVGIGERKENFKLHTIEAKPGDIIYLYTDGYADQFGGPKGKKFKYKPLNELLLTHHQLPFSEQQKQIKAVFETWKGDLEQVDDVCVIGIKV